MKQLTSELSIEIHLMIDTHNLSLISRGGSWIPKQGLMLNSSKALN